MDLQNGGVCGILAGVVTHVMHTYLAEEQRAIIQHLLQKKKKKTQYYDRKHFKHFREESGKHFTMVIEILRR